MSNKYIARNITHLIRQDPETPVSRIIAEVGVMFNSGCSYKKGWNARKNCIEILFGDWNTTFNVLPRYMIALKDSNAGTIVKWKHHLRSEENIKVFHFLFWAFQPSIVGFASCRPVVSVDGTHLRGAYKGVLLIASSWDANNHVFPLAFAIVDEETSGSWGWFLSLLRQYVVQQRQVCLISDRHKGILNSISQQPEWQPPMAFHRYCLRHIRANFNIKFKSRELKELMWRAGTEPKSEKFERLMMEIQNKKPEAFAWLQGIDRDKWTLSYDQGFRYGCMTTNLSESLNSVLKKSRALPLKALVEIIFNKLVQYFNQHREEAIHSKLPFPKKIWDKFRASEQKSRVQRVIQYNARTQVYSVQTPIRGDGRGNHVYTLTMGDRSCTCRKWGFFAIPCSHALAVCKKKGWNGADLIPEIYLKDNYRRTYEASFYPVADQTLWREATFVATWFATSHCSNMVCYKPNMKGSRPGRLHTTRYRSDMDYRNPDSLRRCGNCRMLGHNRRNCPHANNPAPGPST